MKVISEALNQFKMGFSNGSKFKFHSVPFRFIQFNVICMVLCHNIHYLKALRFRPYTINSYPTAHMLCKYLKMVEKNKVPFSREKDLNQTQSGRPSAMTELVDGRETGERDRDQEHLYNPYVLVSSVKFIVMMITINDENNNGTTYG